MAVKKVAIGGPGKLPQEEQMRNWFRKPTGKL